MGMLATEATFFGSYVYGWQQYKKHFLYVFLVSLIYLIAVPQSGVNLGPNFEFLATAYFVLIWPVLSYGAHLVSLKLIRDDKADVREVFYGFKTNYLNIILAHLLTTAIVIIGLILLIVPGIVFLCRLSFVPYLVMDKGLDPVEAVEKSWVMTRGHGFRIFWLYLSTIPVAIVGILILIVGIFVTLPLVGCAFSSLYHAIDLHEQNLLDENGVVA